jgi:hypothetical protein
LRRLSLRSGVPTSALVRALVHRWLQEQGDEKAEAIPDIILHPIRGEVDFGSGPVE